MHPAPSGHSDWEALHPEPFKGKTEKTTGKPCSPKRSQSHLHTTSTSPQHSFRSPTFLWPALLNSDLSNAVHPSTALRPRTGPRHKASQSTSSCTPPGLQVTKHRLADHSLHIGWSAPVSSPSGPDRAVPDATLPSTTPSPSSWSNPSTPTHQTLTESFPPVSLKSHIPKAVPESWTHCLLAAVSGVTAKKHTRAWTDFL